MKKILSLALAAAMVMSALPVAYAAENETDHSNGTEITYIGSQEEAAGGAGDVWTVTVPAKMVPGDTGTVKAEGMWNSDKFLNVYCPQKVALTYGAQTMDVAITGGHFSLVGNSVDPVSKEVEISVEDASRLFGTWEGTIVYDVRLVDKGDANGDGVIDQADVDYYSEINNSQDPEVLARADIDGNGWANTTDLGLLLQVRQGKVITPSNFKN